MSLVGVACRGPNLPVVGDNDPFRRRRPGRALTLAVHAPEALRQRIYTTSMDATVGDSDIRLFPLIHDTLFGYRLHPIDLAKNKLFAAAGRSEPRDIYDLMVIDEAVAPLSVIVWAGVEKSPGFTREGLIAEVRRNLLHPLMRLAGSCFGRTAGSQSDHRESARCPRRGRSVRHAHAHRQIGNRVSRS